MHPRPRTPTQTGHYHRSAVLRAAGQDVVVMRAPVNVEDGSRVAHHHWVILIHSTCLESRFKTAVSPDLQVRAHQEKTVYIILTVRG